MRISSSFPLLLLPELHQSVQSRYFIRQQIGWEYCWRWCKVVFIVLENSDCLWVENSANFLPNNLPNSIQMFCVKRNSHRMISDELNWKQQNTDRIVIFFFGVLHEIFHSVPFIACSVQMNKASLAASGVRISSEKWLHKHVKPPSSSHIKKICFWFSLSSLPFLLFEWITNILDSYGTRVNQM